MSSVSMRVFRWTPLLIFPIVAGCLVTDDRCGEGQVEFSQGIFGACACAENYAPAADNKSCVPCGANEVVMNNMCQCAAGYSKTGGVCMPIPPPDPDAGSQADSGMPPGRLTGNSGQGMACTMASDCAGKDATFCMTLGAMPMCLVSDCGINGTRSCDSDRVCCDISHLSSILPALGTSNGLCLPAAGCTQATGKVVTP